MGKSPEEKSKRCDTCYHAFGYDDFDCTTYCRKHRVWKGTEQVCRNWKKREEGTSDVPAK